MFFLFLCESRTAGGERRDTMAKFLNYEDRLEIETGLKEHMTFTEIGKKLSRDRTTITKEIRNYSVERDTGYGVFPHNTCKYRKGCRRKKYAGHMNVSIHWFQPADSVNCYVTATVNTLRKKYVPTASSRHMYATAVVS